MRSRPVCSSQLLLMLLALTLACTSAETGDPAESPSATQQPSQVEQAETSLESKLDVLNPAAAAAPSVDLATVFGQKPVLLYYWIAGNPRADSTFKELESLVDEIGSESLAFYALALPQPGRDAPAIRKHAEELGIKTPVLDDAGFQMGQMLQVQSVPFMAIFDSQGRPRLANGASLRQTLEYEFTVETAIRRVAESGELGKYGYLPRYYPVKELVGKKCPDFTAPLLQSSDERSWYSLLQDGKLNVLIFWSVDCPHCRDSLPQINAWMKSHSDGVNIITAAKVTDESNRAKTNEFCTMNNFVFSTLEDQDLKISELYRITSTPTVLVIRPDGVIDSVLVSSDRDFGEFIEQKKQELL